MFDLAWSEIALIAVVALIVIGPKDLPTAIKGIAAWIQKGKKMIRDFQSQADDLVKEANLQEVRNQIQDVRSTISDIRNFDLKGMVDKTVDPDGSLKSSLNGMDGGSGSYSTPAWTPPATAANTPGAPAMIPPSTMAPYVPPPLPPTAGDVADAPAFLPPSTPAPPPPPVVAAPVIETPVAVPPVVADLIPPAVLPPDSPMRSAAPAAATTTQA